ncbi:unnamed protein product [Notodromas monacha]|uniref:PHD and RING finger domain-containing protein 1 n=1 Tax=Notodromas monacha TaxID=399045 RepID=A0A7R9BNW8_9CRUS|nr:unnamed protein product [Notodromas monacha]CAG0918121.1 unnamed protein product [Notodromas monacha]
MDRSEDVPVDEEAESDESSNEDDDDSDDEGGEEGEAGGLDSSSEDESTVRCPICLAKLRDKVVGNPEPCDHVFCLECIDEWAKNVNTCPIDRLEFDLILIRDVLDGPVVGNLGVGKAAGEEPQAELIDVNDVTHCEVCGDSDREDRLLLCDGCDAGYHLECLNPPLSRVPIEEWYCPDCDPVERRTRFAREAGINEAELLSLMDAGDANMHMIERSQQQERRMRAIPRTRHSERVLAVIDQRRRATESSGRLSPMSAAIEAVASGAVPIPRLTWCSNPTRRTRKAPKRRKRATTKKRGTTKKKGKRTTKKKGRKATRRSRPVPQTSITSTRCRIAAVLGIKIGDVDPRVRGGSSRGNFVRLTPPEARVGPRGAMPPIAREGPASMRALSLLRYRSGIPNLDLFGSEPCLDPSDDEFDVPGLAQPSSSVLSQSRASSSSSVSVSRLKSAVVDDPARENCTPTFDVLGSILNTQDMLLSKSSHLVVSRYGKVTATRSVTATPTSPNLSNGSVHPKKRAVAQYSGEPSSSGSSPDSNADSSRSDGAPSSSSSSGSTSLPTADRNSTEHVGTGGSPSPDIMRKKRGSGERESSRETSPHLDYSNEYPQLSQQRKSPTQPRTQTPPPERNDEPDEEPAEEPDAYSDAEVHSSSDEEERETDSKKPDEEAPPVEDKRAEEPENPAEEECVQDVNDAGNSSVEPPTENATEETEENKEESIEKSPVENAESLECKKSSPFPKDAEDEDKLPSRPESENSGKEKIPVDDDEQEETLTDSLRETHLGNEELVPSSEELDERISALLEPESEKPEEKELETEVHASHETKIISEEASGPKEAMLDGENVEVESECKPDNVEIESECGTNTEFEAKLRAENIPEEGEIDGDAELSNQVDNMVPPDTENISDNNESIEFSLSEEGEISEDEARLKPSSPLHVPHYAPAPRRFTPPPPYPETVLEDRLQMLEQNMEPSPHRDGQDPLWRRSNLKHKERSYRTVTTKGERKKKPSSLEKEPYNVRQIVESKRKGQVSNVPRSTLSPLKRKLSLDDHSTTTPSVAENLPRGPRRSFSPRSWSRSPTPPPPRRRKRSPSFPPNPPASAVEHDRRWHSPPPPSSSTPSSRKRRVSRKRKRRSPSPLPLPPRRFSSSRSRSFSASSSFSAEERWRRRSGERRRRKRRSSASRSRTVERRRSTSGRRRRGRKGGRSRTRSRTRSRSVSFSRSVSSLSLLSEPGRRNKPKRNDRGFEKRRRSRSRSRSRSVSRSRRGRRRSRTRTPPRHRQRSRSREVNVPAKSSGSTSKNKPKSKRDPEKPAVKSAPLPKPASSSSSNRKGNKETPPTKVVKKKKKNKAVSGPAPPVPVVETPAVKELKKSKKVVKSASKQSSSVASSQVVSKRVISSDNRLTVCVNFSQPDNRRSKSSSPKTSSAPVAAGDRKRKKEKRSKGESSSSNNTGNSSRKAGVKEKQDVPPVSSSGRGGDIGLSRSKRRKRDVVVVDLSDNDGGDRHSDDDDVVVLEKTASISLPDSPPPERRAPRTPSPEKERRPQTPEKPPLKFSLGKTLGSRQIRANVLGDDPDSEPEAEANQESQEKQTVPPLLPPPAVPSALLLPMAPQTGGLLGEISKLMLARERAAVLERDRLNAAVAAAAAQQQQQTTGNDTYDPFEPTRSPSPLMDEAEASRDSAGTPVQDEDPVSNCQSQQGIENSMNDSRKGSKETATISIVPLSSLCSSSNNNNNNANAMTTGESSPSGAETDMFARTPAASPPPDGVTTPAPQSSTVAAAASTTSTTTIMSDNDVITIDDAGDDDVNLSSALGEETANRNGVELRVRGEELMHPSVQQQVQPSVDLSSMLQAQAVPVSEVTAQHHQQQRQQQVSNVLNRSPTSPYSPGSSEGDDLFAPPPDDVLKSRTKSKKPDARKTRSPKKQMSSRGQYDKPKLSKTAFDALFQGSPSSPQPARGDKRDGHKKPKSDATGKENGNSRILEDLPSSAVDMQIKDKFFEKVQRQNRAAEEVKLALKPHYSARRISKEAYKAILGKCVPKITKNKKPINPIKVQQLVDMYVTREAKNRRKSHA